MFHSNKITSELNNVNWYKMYQIYTVYTLLTWELYKYTIQSVKKITAKFARQNFSEILNEVHFGRKKILITRSGKPLVVLISSRDYKEFKKKTD